MIHEEKEHKTLPFTGNSLCSFWGSTLNLLTKSLRHFLHPFT